MSKWSNTNAGASHRSPLQDVSRNASNLAGDAIELAELQVSMLRCDFQQFRHRIWVAVWMIPISIGLLLAGLPTIAFALAGTLTATLDLSPTVGLWIVGGCFFVLAVILAYVAARTISRSLRSFNASQREFQSNLKWIRQMVGVSSPNEYDYSNYHR